jgi:hypothetical protein
LAQIDQAFGDCGFFQTIPDLDQDFDDSRFDDSMVPILKALETQINIGTWSSRI